jgi:hypothetical protein
MRSLNLLLFLIDFTAAWRAGHRLRQDWITGEVCRHRQKALAGLKLRTSGMRPTQRLGILIKIKFRWCSGLL